MGNRRIQISRDLQQMPAGPALKSDDVNHSGNELDHLTTLLLTLIGIEIQHLY